VAFYDLEICPATFNLAEFLVAAEVEAKRLGKEGFILVLVPSKGDDALAWKEFDSVVDAASRQWRMHNMLVPLAALSPACKGTHVLARRAEVARFLGAGPVFPPLYDGVNLRSLDTGAFYREVNRPGLFEGLRAPQQGRRYLEAWKAARGVARPIVTITIREFGFDPARNSNLGAWAEFARVLEARGYCPVIVPDTEAAFSRQHFDEAHLFRECAWNLGLRAALYESAFVNFFVPNGCFVLVLFSTTCSYIGMNFLPAGSIVTTAAAYAQIGHTIGENYKFAQPRQRLCFREDSLANIVAEFDRFERDFGAVKDAA
jgi:hypothetical protein